MRLFIGGDFVPRDDAARRGGDPRAYVDVASFHDADLRVVNFEAPIIAAGMPPRNPVTALSVTDASCAALKLLDVGAVSLANNHIFDYGVDGFLHTVRCLSDAGIRSFGAGVNESEAHQPLLAANGYGLFAYCYVDGVNLRDVPVAGMDTPGVAALTMGNVRKDLDAARDVEHAVLCIHWGREHTSIPPAHVTRLALELLHYPKVRLIAGTHPHRRQGIRRVGDRAAAFSIGHFHVPGFVIEPPVLMSGFERDGLPVTRAFHMVTRRTFMEWPAAARPAIGLSIDTGTHVIQAIPLRQHPHRVRVEEERGLRRGLALTGITLEGWLTRLPAPIVAAIHAVGGAFGLLRLLYWIARSNGVTFAGESLRAWLRFVMRRLRGRG